MTSQDKGWIGVDLDGTLAEYDHWRGIDHIGKPIPAMVERIKKWLEEGLEVKIFTDRIGGARFCTSDYDAFYAAVQRFLVYECGLPFLDITCVNDFRMFQLWDDRAVQVIPNTGRRADGKE